MFAITGRFEFLYFYFSFYSSVGIFISYYFYYHQCLHWNANRKFFFLLLRMFWRLCGNWKEITVGFPTQKVFMNGNATDCHKKKKHSIDHIQLVWWKQHVILIVFKNNFERFSFFFFFPQKIISKQTKSFNRQTEKTNFIYLSFWTAEYSKLFDLILINLIL